MYRDIDPRSDERERDADLARGGRGGTDDRRSRVPVDESRDVFSRDLDLPRGSSPRARPRRRPRVRAARLRGADTWRLSAPFASSLQTNFVDQRRRASVLRKDLEHLRELGLVRTMPYVVGRERTTVVTLTDRGRALLEACPSARDDERRQQAFYAGIAKERELAHDVSRPSARTPTPRSASSADGGRVRRVVLEHELKREYQAFLQAPNRGRRDSSGRPQRDADRDRPVGGGAPAADRRRPRAVPGRPHRVRDAATAVSTSRDMEVMTPHYRGAHAAAKVAAGFARYRASVLGWAVGAVRAAGAVAGSLAWPRRCSGDLRASA